MPIWSNTKNQVLYHHNRLLLSLTRNENIDKGRINEALRAITEAASLGLDVERASIWVYNEDRTAIICLDLFERQTNKHISGIELNASDFPAYFKYLQEERTLPAHNAYTDPATCEFSEVYLKPLKIKSMLDAPIRKNGVAIGVICHEKVGSFRKWTLIDQIFAGAIADIISRAFVAVDRVCAQEALEAINLNLEKIVRQRTHELDQQRAATMQAAKLAGLGTMSAGIAHEINNPLTTIQLLSDQLSDMTEPEKVDLEKLSQIAHNIGLMTTRIAKIINSLRTFSRDSSSDPAISVSIKSVVEEALNLCSQRLKSSQIELKVEIPEDIHLECRPVQIQQVLINLITNASDAIESITSEKWISIQCLKKNDRIEITVTDSGHGIPEHLHDKIMQPFFTTKEVGKGTGLGLSVSMGILKSHGGELKLDSSCPHTRFIMSIPPSQSQLSKKAS